MRYFLTFVIIVYYRTLEKIYGVLKWYLDEYKNIQVNKTYGNLNGRTNIINQWKNPCNEENKMDNWKNIFDFIFY